MLERNRRVKAQRNLHSVASSHQFDEESKLRSMFAAVRAATNTDVDLNTKMSPSELFGATVQVSCHGRHFVKHVHVTVE